MAGWTRQEVTRERHGDIRFIYSQTGRSTLCNTRVYPDTGHWTPCPEVTLLHASQLRTTGDHTRQMTEENLGWKIHQIQTARFLQKHLPKGHRPNDGGSTHLWNVGKLPDLHVATTQTTAIFIPAAMTTWNQTIFLFDNWRPLLEIIWNQRKEHDQGRCEVYRRLLYRHRSEPLEHGPGRSRCLCSCNRPHWWGTRDVTQPVRTNLKERRRHFTEKHKT
jgi:hypothetical protein